MAGDGSYRENHYKEKMYICSPETGDIEHDIEVTKEYCRFTIGCSHIPIAPLLMFSEILDRNSPKDREKMLLIKKELMHWCDEVWVFEDDNLNDVPKDEIKYAEEKRLKTGYVCTDCEEVSGSSEDSESDGDDKADCEEESC